MLRDDFCPAKGVMFSLKLGSAVKSRSHDANNQLLLALFILQLISWENLKAFLSPIGFHWLLENFNGLKRMALLRLLNLINN